MSHKEEVAFNTQTVFLRQTFPEDLNNTLNRHTNKYRSLDWSKADCQIWCGNESFHPVRLLDLFCIPECVLATLTDKRRALLLVWPCKKVPKKKLLTPAPRHSCFWPRLSQSVTLQINLIKSRNVSQGLFVLGALLFCRGRAKGKETMQSGTVSGERALPCLLPWSWSHLFYFLLLEGQSYCMVLRHQRSQNPDKNIHLHFTYLQTVTLKAWVYKKLHM